MRKLVIAALMAIAAVVPANVAVSHPLCGTSVAPPQRIGSTVAFDGTMTCTQQHNSFVIAIYLDRRTPGGSWTQVDSDVQGYGPGTSWQNNDLHQSYNCAKQYRTVVLGNASPGSHNNQSTSSILGATC